MHSSDILIPRTALLSVSDKRGLLAFAHALAAHGVRLLASGGTAALLRPHLEVTDISTHTGFPEILGGRVKTLHPTIHGGILAPRTPEDLACLAALGITPIDLVICNLYPFAATIARADCTREAAIEEIDIGGPTLLRAAAKNHAAVAAITDPDQYPAICAELARTGGISHATRLTLARHTFARTAAYDAEIAAYFATQDPEAQDTPEALPERLTLSLTRHLPLRYGENPDQRAAAYTLNTPAPHSLLGAPLLQGKPLSFNNLLDADAALALIRDFSDPTCAIFKHTNPCGVASAPDLITAYQQAFAADPQSAFGGILIWNRPLDVDLLRQVLTQQFAEVLLAPSFSPEALEYARTKPALRLLAYGPEPATPTPMPWDIRSISGGLLLQSRDRATDRAQAQQVSQRTPTREEWDTLWFAERICRHVRSNAIVLAGSDAHGGSRTLGIGAGQTSRVFSVTNAIERARLQSLALEGAVLVSDGFFPFPDSLECAARAGITAVLQPGGSIRDPEIIATADRLGIALVHTHTRHFKH